MVDICNQAIFVTYIGVAAESKGVFEQPGESYHGAEQGYIVGFLRTTPQGYTVETSD